MAPAACVSFHPFAETLKDWETGVPVVEDATGTLLKRTARATLHAIHSVFPTPEATGTPDAKDPISEEKLAKGDARWDTQKEILGYRLDGIHRTIQLPPDRADLLLNERSKASSRRNKCR
jgi:hypothetical protein